MSLTKIAETFGYANTYFSRLFKELFGMNFTSYLEKVRIEHACELLKMDMTLEKIAELTGYNSGYVPVSYTHLDVYKRQIPCRIESFTGKGNGKEYIWSREFPL